MLYSFLTSTSMAISTPVTQRANANGKVLNAALAPSSGPIAPGVTLMQTSLKQSQTLSSPAAADTSEATERHLSLSKSALAAYPDDHLSTIDVHDPSRSFGEYFQYYWGSMICEAIFLFLGVTVLWFNELRSVKMDTLLSRGRSECETIEASGTATEETLGCLVHVSGQTVPMMPVEDPQFQGAVVKNCLKLQSTVEVYEWVQTVKMNPAGRDAREGKPQIQHAFHKEWSTVHRNSLQFQRTVGKPSPDNPRPPRSLNLGTFTSTCKHVQLGGFTLPEDMVEQFRKFEPAMRHLPPTVQACGLVFYANKDGYFYSRPSMRSMWTSKGGPSVEPMVGDVRVRFLCVPQGNATAVAVHCNSGDRDTFVPYRAIPRGCCSNESQDRLRLIEEGARSLQEVKLSDMDMAPCLTQKGMMTSCFCCPCSTISSVCSKEVVTEEIYYISEELDPIDKPFEGVVQRNCWRVWAFRVVGWMVCYLTFFAVASTLNTVVQSPVLHIYGTWASAVLAAVVSTACSALVISIAYMCYSPSQSMKWAFAVAAVIVLPFIVAQLNKSSNGMEKGSWTNRS